MPHILVKITRNPETVTLNFGGNHASNVRIIQFGMTGLPSPETVFLEILGQPITPMITNGVSTQFPLGTSTGPNSFEHLSHPIVVTSGDNMWNDGHQLTLRVFGFNNLPVQFTNIWVLFQYEEVDPRSINRFGQNQVERVESKETVGRNVHPLSWFSRIPFVDSDQSTSYPYKN